MSIQVRKVILQSRLYRLFAILFAGVGCLVFLILFLGGDGGFSVFRTGGAVLFFVAPFLPAAFLSWYAGRLEKKYFELIDKLK